MKVTIQTPGSRIKFGVRKSSSEKWVREAEFVYRNAEGRPLYRAVRSQLPDGGKRFSQEAFRDGRWASGKGAMQGVRRVPYHLPELLASNDTVLITEGEKHADRLIELGFTATSSVGGAGKWAQYGSLAERFRGRDVVILPDNDEPGRKHAEGIARDLAGCTASIRILELPGLPPKGDVLDGSKSVALLTSCNG